MNIIGVELGVARAAKQLEHIVKPHLDSEGRPIIPTKLHEALKIRAANAVSDATNMTMRQSMPSLVNGTDDDSSSLES